jgi:glucose-1-phosphate adenylyltransferase
MLNFAKAQDRDLIIASLPVEKEDAHRMGILKVDSASRITSFIEKPKDPALLKEYALSSQSLQEHALSHPTSTHYLASMGIYIFKKQALLDLVDLPGDDFGKDLIPLYVRANKASAYIYKGYWEDIGTIASYYRANMALLTQQHCLNTNDPYNPIFTHPHNLPSPLISHTTLKNTLVSQGSFIEAQEVLDSVIGLNLHVGKNSKIHHCILLGSLFHHSHKQLHRCIGRDCVIKNAIIDEEATIGNNVTLVNAKQFSMYDSESIFIRDGIIIVTAGAHIPDGFTL